MFEGWKPPQWQGELAAHVAYWTPERQRSERVAAGMRATLRRELRRLRPELADIVNGLSYRSLVALLANEKRN
jgi:hypothetical protein